MKKRFEGENYHLAVPAFDDIYPKVKKNTMVGDRKLKILYEGAIATRYMRGDAAEAGVWGGGVMYLLASVYAGMKKVHGFDSWQGLPGLTEEDCVSGTERVVGLYKGGARIGPPVEYLAEFGDDIVLHDGWFADTFPTIPETQKYCLVHVDCDLYRPIKECCEFFVPRMVPGGWLIFDDYIDADRWPGAPKAVDEYFETCERQFDWFTWSNNGVVMRFRE